jgi:uncharacterized phage protein (TIGR01671 family)
MNRDIKFRAWDKNNKGFINGFNMIGFSTGQGAPKKILQRFSTEWNIEDVELMQYTGIKDTKGKEICEGDIIQFTWETDSCWGKAGTYLGYIKFDKGSFQVAYLGKLKEKRLKKDAEDYDNISSFMYWSEDVMVIKNIYENPEILEG